MVSVSYTHLDVYKRQPSTLSLWRNQLILQSGTPSELVLANQDRPQPVSYTHLDVYKRQSFSYAHYNLHVNNLVLFTESIN